jgi:RNA polymerase sigma factor (TIGR02999 family)
MSDVSRILSAIDAGDPQAVNQLLPLVYDELRKLAARHMANEAPGHTLDATALVHEAYLRLIGEQQFANRRHFFAAAAEAMRRILIESARRQASLKRGGGLVRRELVESELIAPELTDDVLALDEALAQLASVDAEAAELVKLRYFVGLTSQQTADAMDLSLRSVERIWAYARAWLFNKLES